MLRRSFLKSIAAAFFVASAIGLERVLGEEPEEPESDHALDLNYVEYDSFGELIDALNSEPLWPARNVVPDGWMPTQKGDPK